MITNRMGSIMAIVGLMVAATPATAAQVRTQSGVVAGSTEDGIAAYKGIPFAAPPVGENRWRDPVPVTPWSAVKQATVYGPNCPQPARTDMGVNARSKAATAEDCLYLNVWTPAASADEKLPVMVWIYGGGFVAGASSEPRQDGENLARKGVVVVSFNYRLGVFGFFTHPELTAESRTKSCGN